MQQKAFFFILNIRKLSFSLYRPGKGAGASGIPIRYEVTEMEKIKLIEAAAKGDASAFASLYGAYKDRLYRYAYYRLGDAEASRDAVQDAVLDAFRGIGGLREPAAFEGWLFRILKVRCDGALREIIRKRTELSLEEQRERARQGDGPSPDAFLQAPDPSEDAGDRISLLEALRQLTEQERDIVLMSVVLGLRSPEIAEETGLTAGAVRSKLSRSLGKLRGILT